MIDLVKEDNPVLYKEAELLPKDHNLDLDKLLFEMSKLMELRGGIGLAAPQVGIPYKFYILGITPKLIINPEIIFTSEQKLKNVEGCLSFPNLFLNVERYSEIELRYENIKSEEVIERFVGTMSRCAQHETDHINGIVFKDRVSKLSLDIAERKRKKIQKRRV